MKKTLLKLITLLSIFGLLSACSVEQTEEGNMPDVDVDYTEGNLPEYDVDTADVDLEMEEETVTVPDVDVDVDEEEKTITVPDVDIDMPGDE